MPACLINVVLTRDQPLGKVLIPEFEDRTIPNVRVDVDWEDDYSIRRMIQYLKNNYAKDGWKLKTWGFVREVKG